MIPQVQNQTTYGQIPPTRGSINCIAELPLSLVNHILSFLEEDIRPVMDPADDLKTRDMKAREFRNQLIPAVTTIFMDWAKYLGLSQDEVRQFVKKMVANQIIDLCNRNGLSLQEAGIKSYLSLITLSKTADLSLTVLRSDGRFLQMDEQRALEIAANCPRIDTIHLRSNAYTDRGVQGLIAGKRIKSLVLDASKLTSSSVQEIAKHPLEELHLVLAVNLTDQDVDALCTISSLKRLTLGYPQKISQASIEKLNAKGFEHLSVQLAQT